MKGTDMAGLAHDWESKSLGEIIASRFKAFWTAPVLPDPWPREVEDAVRSPEALPVCHRCLTPQDSPTWFCPECGTAVGPYNNIMPYLYIFSLGEVFRSGVEREARFTRLTVPGYILLALTEMPFLAPLYCLRLFLNWRKVAKARSDDTERPSPDDSTPCAEMDIGTEEG